MKRLWFYLFGSLLFMIYSWIFILGNDPLQPMIASKILRFHVLANSDSIGDQALKERVRDAVGGYLNPLLKSSENLEETKNIIESHMTELIDVAEDTISRYGYDYEVSAKVARIDFPEKTYGEYTFPKGRYEALQLTIGQGEGRNWWCVLYPNMCFKGSVYEIVEEDAKKALREVLSPWEYADVFQNGKVELRFKFLEYLKN